MTYPTFLELWKSDRQKCYEWLAERDCCWQEAVTRFNGRQQTLIEWGLSLQPPRHPDYSLGENVWRMRGLAINKDADRFTAALGEALGLRTIGDILWNEEAVARSSLVATAPDTAILWAAGRVTENV